ncbi:MAG: PfkB family carbohydrate kinase [Candidatus Krumholzibacteria bacterium]|nr:PfkB family carbohydrate kinase [Candidatus Krumholzibacteria bacterium]
MDLVIVGSVALDTIETPRGKVERALGGSAVYASLATSLFCRTGIVGVVGEDFTDDHRRLLEGRGIDLSGLESVAGGRTFFWQGRYGADPNERETITTELNVFERFRPRLPEAFLGAGHLFLGNIDPELQLLVLDRFPERPVTACDTMNYWIESKPERLRDVLERSDILFVNDGEARQLSGETNLLRAARSISAWGPRVLVIKKGEHGAHLFARGEGFIAPAFPLEDVVDPTGAGDTFAGGFMGAIAAAGSLEDEDLRRAMVFGAVAASFTCERFSVERLAGLTIEEIRERYDRLAALARFARD